MQPDKAFEGRWVTEWRFIYGYMNVCNAGSLRSNRLA
jgi:hypothetical protein